MSAPDIDSEDYSDMDTDELDQYLLEEHKHKHDHEHKHEHDHEHDEHDHEHKHKHKHEHDEHDNEHKHKHEHEHDEHDKHKHDKKRKHETEDDSEEDDSGEDNSEEDDSGEEEDIVKEKSPEPSEKKHKKEASSDTKIYHEVGKEINLNHGLKIVNHTLFSSENPTADLGDKAIIKYVGKLASNKKVFDSGDLTLTIGEHTTIPGFEYGIVGMQVNGKRTIKIPSALGYGKKGMPPEIPQNANLLFEVQLKSLSKGKDKKGKEKKDVGKRQLSPKI